MLQTQLKSIPSGRFFFQAVKSSHIKSNTAIRQGQTPHFSFCEDIHSLVGKTLNQNGGWFAEVSRLAKITPKIKHGNPTRTVPVSRYSGVANKFATDHKKKGGGDNLIPSWPKLNGTNKVRKIHTQNLTRQSDKDKRLIRVATGR